MKPELRRSCMVALGFVVVLCAAAGLVDCGPPLEPQPLPTYSPASCAEACDNAAKLCGPATLKPKTGTCANACDATESNGGDFRTGCLSHATTCPAVEACSR